MRAGSLRAGVLEAMATPEQLEAISDDDRAFFMRFPQKRWRLRSLGPARLRFGMFGPRPEGLTQRGIERFALERLGAPEH